MTRSSVSHVLRIFEDADGTAFAGCSCGWVGAAWQDQPVADCEPPFALAHAHNEAYGHTYRTGQLGLDA